MSQCARDLSPCGIELDSLDGFDRNGIHWQIGPSNAVDEQADIGSKMQPTADNIVRCSECHACASAVAAKIGTGDDRRAVRLPAETLIEFVQEGFSWRCGGSSVEKDRRFDRTVWNLQGEQLIGVSCLCYSDDVGAGLLEGHSVSPRRISFNRLA